MRRVLLFLACLTLVAATSAAVQASSITATYNGDVDAIWGLNINAPGIQVLNNSATGKSQFSTTVGGLNYTSGNPSGLDPVAFGALAPTFYAYCIDLGHTITAGFSGTWNVVALNGLGTGVNGVGIDDDHAAALRRLWTLHSSDALSNDANLVASFQFAVWDIVYNYDATMTWSQKATFTGGPAAITSPDNLLVRGDNWAAAAVTSGVAESPLFAMVSTNGVQSFEILVGVAAAPAVGSIPVPAAVFPGMMMLAAMGGFALIRRRRRSEV